MTKTVIFLASVPIEKKSILIEAAQKENRSLSNFMMTASLREAEKILEAKNG